MIDKYRRMSSQTLRVTTIVMITFSVLFLVSGFFFQGIWDTTLLFMTSIAMGIIFILTFIFLFLHIRQAMKSQEEQRYFIVTCLMFLSNIPILAIFAFLMAMIMLITTGLPPQD